MNNRGTIAVLSALFAVPIVLTMGLALDMSQVWLLRQRMQWSVDSAALLGASQSNSQLGPQVTKDAQELFWANYGAASPKWNAGTQTGFLGSSSNGATVIPASAAVAATTTTPAIAAKSYVTVTATATLPTALMKIAGINLSTVTVTSVAAVPHNVEMTLVLDNSLSMQLAIVAADGTTTTKLDALKTAANNLLTTIFGGGSSSPNVYIGIVPFAGAVNIGNNAIGRGLLKAGTLGVPGSPFPTTKADTDVKSSDWRGCVRARAYPSPAVSYDGTEDAPLSEVFKFDPYYSSSTKTDPLNTSHLRGDNDWTATSITDTSTSPQHANTNYLSPTGLTAWGPNLYCMNSTIVKLTNVKADLNTSISSMVWVNGGGTIMNQGLQWGWFTLSPLWTIWGLPKTATGADRPAAYTDDGTTKIIVFMTDGVNEADGIDTNYAAAANQGGQSPSNCDQTNPVAVWPECTSPFIAGKNHDSWYTSYGRVSSNSLSSLPAATSTGDAMRADAKTILETRLGLLCKAIKGQVAGKNDRIIIYTIFFHGTTDDQVLGAAVVTTAGNDLKACATDIGHYFDSKNGAAINTAFQQIAQDINDLRLKQ